MYRKYDRYIKKHRTLRTVVLLVLVVAVLYLAAVYATSELVIEREPLAEQTLEVHTSYELPTPKASLKLPLFFDKEIKTTVETSGSVATDKLGRYKIEYNSNIDYENAIKDFLEFICSESLAVEFVIIGEDLETIDINGYNVGFKQTKV